MKVPAALDGARLDVAAASLWDLPRAVARRLCDAGRVRVNGRRAKKGDRLRTDDEIDLRDHFDILGTVGSISWLRPREDGDASIPILFADDGVLVVDKPPGVPCHPLVPGEGGTLVDAVAAMYPEIATASETPREAGLVHRLDTGTSGCVAIARTRERWTTLRAAFAAHAVEKTYIALVDGVVRAPLRIDAPLAHDSADPRRMRTTTRGGLDATTHARPLSTGPSHSLVEVTAPEGRRHQVRAHLALAGHPLVGDVLYGGSGETAEVPWHLLHARSLKLPDRPLVLAPLPVEFRRAILVRGVSSDS